MNSNYRTIRIKEVTHISKDGISLPKNWAEICEIDTKQQRKERLKKAINSPSKIAQHTNYVPLEEKKEFNVEESEQKVNFNHPIVKFKEKKEFDPLE